MERCPRCASPLTFAGLNKQGKRVLTCTANLMSFDVDTKQPTSVACDLLGTLYINNEKAENVQWHRQFRFRSTT